MDRRGIYPYEVVFHVHVLERGWFPYMISDPCCLHSMMACALAFLGGHEDSCRIQLARCHLGRTLEILQARLHKVDSALAIADATIMVVTTLIALAELEGDLKTMSNHMHGLAKIVGLRGGLHGLSTNKNLPVKVCRSVAISVRAPGKVHRLAKMIELVTACTGLICRMHCRLALDRYYCQMCRGNLT